MKKRLFFSVSILIFLLTSLLLAYARITWYQTGTTQTLTISEGWNFVGFPTSISRAELGLVVVFEFRNNKWQRFEGQTLEQFKGYFVATAQHKSVAYTLPATIPRISLTKGWNTISIPVEIKIKDARFKGEIIGQKLGFYIYSGRWVGLNVEMVLTPGNGYLVYAQEAGELSYAKEAAPTCTDKVKNGAETDIDCGGWICPKCANSKECNMDYDCGSGICKNHLCIPSTCINKVKDSDETDIDCGGMICLQCEKDKECKSDNDCVSKRCVSNKCVAPAKSRF